MTIKAFQYDLVCNGYEIASGGIRNHLPETMVKAFEIVGLSRETVEEHFGGLYRAFQYGAPPHGGMAAGIDRIVMLLVGAKNLREVTMFPMNQQAHGPVDGRAVGGDCAAIARAVAQDGGAAEGRLSRPRGPADAARYWLAVTVTPSVFGRSFGDMIAPAAIKANGTGSAGAALISNDFGASRNVPTAPETLFISCTSLS